MQCKVSIGEVAFKLAVEFREELLRLHPEFTERHIGKQPIEEVVLTQHA